MDDMTPIEALEAGQEWAINSLVNWMQQYAQRDELRDLLIERQSDIARDSLREKWQAWVLEA